MEYAPSPLLPLTAGDIKQYLYCPRIIFYRYLMPSFRFTTYKMKEGNLRQREEIILEKRRTLVRFGITGWGRKRALSEDDIQRYFSLKLSSDRLGLSGIVDMAIVTPAEVIPIDFKDGAFSLGKTIALHHKYQLLAYGLLLEETFKKRAERGFVHSLEDGSTKEVLFTEGARTFLLGKMRKMRGMIHTEAMPEGTPYWGRCRECEYRLFCHG